MLGDIVKNGEGQGFDFHGIIPYGKQMRYNLHQHGLVTPLLPS